MSGNRTGVTALNKTILVFSLIVGLAVLSGLGVFMYSISRDMASMTRAVTEMSVAVKHMSADVSVMRGDFKNVSTQMDVMSGEIAKLTRTMVPMTSPGSMMPFGR